MRIPTLSATALLMLTVTLTACGGAAPTAATPSAPAATTVAAVPTSAPPAAQKTTDTCALITQQEATTALGSDPGPGAAAGKEGQGVACIYTKASGGFLQVGVNQSVTRALFDDGKKKVQDAYQQVPEGAFVDLSSMGDAAFVASNPHGGACEFLKGSALGHVTIVSPTAMPTPAETLTNLCRLLVGRI